MSEKRVGELKRIYGERIDGVLKVLEEMISILGDVEIDENGIVEGLKGARYEEIENALKNAEGNKKIVERNKERIKKVDKRFVEKYLLGRRKMILKGVSSTSKEERKEFRIEYYYKLNGEQKQKLMDIAKKVGSEKLNELFAKKWMNEKIFHAVLEKVDTNEKLDALMGLDDAIDEAVKTYQSDGIRERVYELADKLVGLNRERMKEAVMTIGGLVALGKGEELVKKMREYENI